MPVTTFEVACATGDTVFLPSGSALLTPATVVEVTAETFVRVQDENGAVTTHRFGDILTRDAASARVAEIQAIITPEA